MDNPEVWRDIRDRDGSVQHLDFLSENEKDTFKTYSEIDQLVIIYQAANRQNPYDQGQSLNIIVHPDMPTKDINKIHITAWKLGLKSLYYQHSMNAAQKFKQKKECKVVRVSFKLNYYKKKAILLNCFFFKYRIIHILLFNFWRLYT